MTHKNKQKGHDVSHNHSPNGLSELARLMARRAAFQDFASDQKNRGIL